MYFLDVFPGLHRRTSSPTCRNWINYNVSLLIFVSVFPIYISTDSQKLANIMFTLGNDSLFSYCIYTHLQELGRFKAVSP